ncbi:unnamed protein product [Ceratitis capitata]|uniref:(Mediterranean fruit fly) hypothetical protein n=1 Tax=Ceratitis capitata TaxID=7213 RepID=A0A811V0H6_CERCA|nr:unnamed protein product [Ceratitis capitata]
MQPSGSQLTKVALQSTPIPNVPQNSAQSTRSQQLKQRHSALVKLLESDPITKNKAIKPTVTSIRTSRENNQKQQELVLNISATECKRLKPIGISPPLLVEHTTIINNAVETGISCTNTSTTNVIDNLKEFECLRNQDGLVRAHFKRKMQGLMFSIKY